MINTARLTLRTFQQEDVDQLAAVFGDPRVMAFSDHGILGDEARCDWLQRALLSSDDHELPLMLAICLNPDNSLIGFFSLSDDLQRVKDTEAELGFRLAHASRVHGFATEAAQAMIAHARNLSRTQRIVAVVDPNNEKSVRVLEKIGMTYEVGVMFSNYDYPDHRYALDLTSAAH